MFQGISQAGSQGMSSALGTYAGYRIGAKSDKKAFERQIWLMRNAHQLEVADLRDAGLNPILSAGGSGAHPGSVSNTASSSAMSGMSTGSSTGKDMAALVSGELESRIKANNAASARDMEQAGLVADQRDTLYTPPGEVYVNGKKVPDSPAKKQAMADAEFALQRARGAGYENVRSAAEAGIYDKHKDWLVPAEMIIRGVGEASGALGSAAGAFKNLKGLKGGKPHGVPKKTE